MSLRSLATPSQIAPLAALALLAWALTGCGGAGSDGDSPGEALPRGERFNVLLISLDTTRADRLGAYGYPGDSTPRIDELAHGGVLFRQCVAPTPLTLPSHSSMMTGTDPFVHGARDNGAFFLHDDNRTLAEALSGRGYATAAELGSYVLNAEFGLDQGFDTYHNVRDGRTERTAEEVAADALAQLRGAARTERPFFLFVHFFDAHAPYQAPRRFAEIHPDPYVAEIAYVDEQVGRLIDELERLGLRRRTLVVLTADHGESLGEHGEPTHSYFVYDATVAVPLIFSAPGILSAGRRLDAQVRLIDLAPTILDFVGAGEPDSAQGVSLLPLLGGENEDLRLEAYSESFFPLFNLGYSQLRAIRHDGWKYVHAPRPELYDLDEDPGELRNLAPDEPARVEHMRERLREWIAAAPGRQAPEAGRRQITPEETARLRSLGYLAGGLTSGGATTELELFDPTGPDPKDHVGVMVANGKALALFRAGDLAGARQILDELLAGAAEARPDLAGAHEFYAKVLTAEGDFGRAAEHYRASLRARPRHTETMTNLGAALIEIGAVDEALQILEQAVRIRPTFAKTHQNFGTALLEKKRFAEATVQFGEAIAIDPSLSAAYVGLGRSLAGEGRGEDALAALRRGVALLPGEALPRRQLAEMLIGLNRPDEAREQYVALIRLSPDDARVHRGLGLAELQLGRPEAAVESLQRSVDLNPGSARGWYSLSGAQATLGRIDDAIASAERARELATGDGASEFAERIRNRIAEYRALPR